MEKLELQISQLLSHMDASAKLFLKPHSFEDPVLEDPAAGNL